MKHHMMLFFLSDMHVTKTQELSHTLYQFDSHDPQTYDCVQTNESAIRYLDKQLRKKNERLETLVYFASNKTNNVMAYREQGQEKTLIPRVYVKKRLRQFCPSLRTEDAFYEFDFDETAPTEDAILQVTQIAQYIRSYILHKQWNVHDVLLHADMTGGPRHASMMMLSVMQLLKYSGIATGNVLYSNYNDKRIEDVTEIYRMFNLISGADEFVKFGSVQEIEAYFAEEGHTPRSRELNDVLAAMQKFTQSIQICRTGNIEPALQALQQTIAVFEAYTHKNLKENLFLHILNIFKKEYGTLLNDRTDQLEIILWCVHKNYLQQAMTLCTEWLPAIIVKKGICMAADGDADEVVYYMQNRTKDYESWQKKLLVDLRRNSMQDIITANRQTQCYRAIETYIKTKNAEKALQQCTHPAKGLSYLFDHEQSIKKTLAAIQKQGRPVTLLGDTLQPVQQILQIIWNLEKKRNAYRGSFEKFVRHYRWNTAKNQDIDGQNFYRRIQHVVNEPDMLDVLYPAWRPSTSCRMEQPAVLTEAQILPVAAIRNTVTAQERDRMIQIQKMMHAGILQTRCQPERAMRILLLYLRIKNERNQINHANQEAYMSNADIVLLMQTIIQEIQTVQ